TGGRNTEAEQGASKGQQQGQGETSNKPGEQVKADGKTGQSAKDQPGAGAESPKKPGGDGSPTQPTAQGQPQNAPEGQQPNPAQSDARGVQQNAPPGQQASEKSGDQNPAGGGQANQSAPQPPPPDAEAPPADPFNRVFAEKQTDLALDYLKDQLAKEKPDPELLDALGGWSREDLEKFAQRWEAMKRAAVGQDDQSKAARAKLDDALRSLGLRNSKAAIGSDTKSDTQRGMHESRRIAPPPGWEEQIRAYRRSLGRQE
ncbi:MAG: hypothetical protein NTW96_25615, partial [Planctomycetia bacterium]|nr:hypothetical protein [Planctomycetia bacterium]